MPVVEKFFFFEAFNESTTLQESCERYEARNGRQVNHFSDKLLSDSYLIAVFSLPLLKIFYRGHVTQSLLYTLGYSIPLCN
jgi:hypothetical protein